MGGCVCLWVGYQRDLLLINCERDLYLQSRLTHPRIFMIMVLR